MLLNLLELVDKYKLNITGVIHIGAHYGEELEVYNKIPSIQSIVMFEPAPRNFEVLKSRINDPKVILVNKALGPFSCKMQMNVETNNNGQSNSVLDPKIHLQQYPHITFNEKIEIKVDPLDKYEPNKTLNFINIDVQGFELEVFRGARNTLKKVDYIMTEVNRDEVYENCAKFDELSEFLSKYGFVCVEVDWAGSTWGDAFFVKKHLLNA
jgi:FkbM family methyltransferase